MPTTRFMTTVLPHSIDPGNAERHVSLFFSHRLDGGGELSSYPAVLNWPATLSAALANGGFSLRTDTSPGDIKCTVRLGQTSQDAWKKAFPATTKVRDFPKPTVADTTWQSYPANQTPEHSLDAHYASSIPSPVSRPGVVGNCLADSVLNIFYDVEGLSRLIRGLQNYGAQRGSQLSVLRRERADAANSLLDPGEKPAPEIPPAGGGGDPHIAPGEPGPAWVSPIEMLLEHENTDALISKHLDDLVKKNDDALGGAAAMLRDVHAAQSFYQRPLADNPPKPRPTAGVHMARAEHEPPDFHERAAGACNVPALARLLGLVVDVVVDAAHLQYLETASRIWCDVTVANAERYVAPETLCIHDDNKNFLARAKDTNRWHFGRLRLGDPKQFRVMDLDPDAAGLSLEQHLRSAIRALAIEANGDSGSFAPAGLRSTGFALAEIKRPKRLREDVQASESLGDPVVVAHGGMQPRKQFNFEGLLRGTRVEVWDDVSKKWHSVHERIVKASFGKDVTIRDNLADTGFLQNPPMSKNPDAADQRYYVHEVMAGWEGWSLSAPRPGKQVIHNHTGPDAGGERLTDTSESTEQEGLWVRSTAKPKSLPALRYGRKYSFRIAGVDLAGNSVPMAQTPAAQLEQPLIDSAAAHLDALRSEAADRDAARLLGELKAKGALYPPTLGDGEGTRADVEQAMASVIDHASSVRHRPQWDIEPQALATLFADTTDPTSISTPRPFLRWDPVPAPTLVPRHAYATGESLQRMVIRTGMTSTPGLCERHVAPPKGSELEAEQDGRLDALMAVPGNRARAYAIALKERGSLFHKKVQDLNDPDRTLAQPGIALLASPNATDLVPLEALQDDPDKLPAEGQYIVHDVNTLVLPYLPDPMADGAALVFYEAGADHRLTNPRVLQSVAVKYAGTWPEIEPLRLVLHNAPRLDARQEGNIIHVGLPPGEQVAVKYSTTLDDDHLKKMGLWASHPVNDPNVPGSDRLVLAEAARNGWMWWLTPDEDLRLVHATARPAILPRISRLSARPRTRDIATAALDGVLDVHGASTDKIELRAVWSDPIDDPEAPDWVERTTAEVVEKYQIGESERYSLLTPDFNAQQVGTRKVTEPIRIATHTFPDTKARSVKYRLYGSSRYREFFTPNELPDVNDAGSQGNVVEVNVPSSSVPAPAVVHDAIPMFMWEQSTEPEQPFAVRRVRRSGVRVWLDRPWFSSGRGEMLAVIATGDPALAGGKAESVSLWARDPIIAGPDMTKAYEVPVLAAWQQRAVQLRLKPETLPGRPELHAIKKGEPTNGDRVVNAHAFTPQFHKERKRWFVDVVLESASAMWPFLRLAVARYQPNSIADVEFSEVTTTDFVQLPPERIGTLSRPDDGQVRITVTGTTAVTAAPGVQVPAQKPTRRQLLTLLPKSRRVVATLQARNKVSGSDLDWIDLKKVDATLAGVDAKACAATWTAALPLDPHQALITPGTSEDLRVQVEEFENFSADAPVGSDQLATAERLVYVDHFYL